MKTAIVPAQVTTIEDRLIGNFTVAQLMLLCVPLFTDGFLFVVLPPVIHASAYKLSLMLILAIFCGGMAIRIKGTIALSWTVKLLRYSTRPRYYIFDKRSTYSRPQNQLAPTQDTEEDEVQPSSTTSSSLRPRDERKVREFLEAQASNVTYETRKGELYVHVTEVRTKS